MDDEQTYSAGDRVSVLWQGETVPGTITGHFDYPPTPGYAQGRTDYSIALLSGALFWAAESLITPLTW
jgi:hypothetical protein